MRSILLLFSHLHPSTVLSVLFCCRRVNYLLIIVLCVCVSECMLCGRHIYTNRSLLRIIGWHCLCTEKRKNKNWENIKSIHREDGMNETNIVDVDCRLMMTLFTCRVLLLLWKCSCVVYAASSAHINVLFFLFFIVWCMIAWCETDRPIIIRFNIENEETSLFREEKKKKRKTKLFCLQLIFVAEYLHGFVCGLTACIWRHRTFCLN